MTPREQFLHERDLLFREIGRANGPWLRAKGAVIRAAEQAARNMRRGGDFDRETFDRNIDVLGGSAMEDSAAMLHATNQELETAKATMQTLVNDLKTAAEIIGPSLMEHVKQIRATRMTVLTETRQMLTELRDIRKFFFEDDYGVEMQRLERFVAVCQALRDLKREGVLDAVADIALRLAVKDPP